MIEIRGLEKRFGDIVALDALDLDVREGEVLGLLGPNGAGKTTTMLILCGLLSPTRGTVAIGGVDVVREPARARGSFGLVPDTPPLYDWLTVREYLGFVASLYRVDAARRDERAEHFLAALGLFDVQHTLCKALSHGTRKKAHLAAMLTVGPPVLIMDEPTNGLDPHATHAFKNLLAEQRAAGTTVLLSTHVLDVAQAVSDRIGVLHHGRLVACGDLDELRSGAAAGTLEEVFLALTRGGPES